MKHTPSPQPPLLLNNNSIQMGHPKTKKDVTSSSPPPPPLPPQTSGFSNGEVPIRVLVKSQELLRKLKEMLVETPAEVNAAVIIDEVRWSIGTVISAIQEIGVKVENVGMKMVELEKEDEDEEKSTVRSKPRKGADLLKGKKGEGIKRKRSNGSSSTKVESKTLEDSYSWRKYGQKEIQYAKFPRSYYRCSHRFDLGCKARRHVQQNEDDPPIYHITYFDEHICRDIRSKKPHHHQGFESSTPTAMVESSKQEDNQDVHVIDDDGEFYSDLLLPLSAPAATTTMTHLSSNTMYELGDVTSSFHASNGFEMDFIEDIFSEFQGKFI